MVYIRILTKPVFGIAMLVLLSLLVTTLVTDQVSHLKRERDWLAHTYVVINNIDELLLKLTQAESAQRSFVLSRRNESLVQFDNLTREPDAGAAPDPATIDGRLAALRTLITDNPVQRDRVDRLEILVRQKTDFMKDIIAFVPGHTQDEAKEHAKGRGIELMAKIESTVRDMESEENRLLKLRTEQEERLGRNVAAICIGLGLLLIAVIAAALIAIQRELRRRRIAEEALRDSTALQTTMLQIAPYAIIAADKNGLITMFNPAAERMLDYTAVEMVGKATPAIFHDPDEVAARARELSAELGYKIEPGFEVHSSKPSIFGCERTEWTYIRKDGLRFPVQLIVTPVPDGKGGISGFFGIAEDITERKRIERMKNEFISTVSHELRTPLTSIRGSLGLILADVAGPLADKARELITIAFNNSERLVRLINDILDIEKIESGHIAIDLRPVAVGPLLRQAIAENTAFAEKYEVGLALLDETGDAQVEASPDHLLQVLTNLLSNAVKFSPAGAQVLLSATADNETIRFEVVDRGGGIPEDFQPRIFEKFSQADASDSRAKSGTGLGLSISKTLVEKMHGAIGFHSVPGRTAFHVELRRTVAAEAAGQLQGQARPGILIVEDDADIANLLRMILTHEGYECRMAVTAAEAKRYLAKESFVAMTLDLKLPDQDGLALIRELRADPRTLALPIIVISIRAEEGQKILNGHAVGIVDWLQKPINIDRLQRAVRGLPSTTKMPAILHLEDDADVARILSLSLKDRAEFTHVSTLAAARQFLAERSFDLAILDVELPDGNGLDLIPALVDHAPPIPVIILSATEVSKDVQLKVEVALIKSVVSEKKIADIIQSVIQGDTADETTKGHPLYRG